MLSTEEFDLLKREKRETGLTKAGDYGKSEESF
jgi:hypothetical protein